MSRYQPSITTKNRIVSVKCTDNDRSLSASLISSRADAIVVEFPNGIRITMHKYVGKPGLYVGNSGGLEFQCNPT